MKKLSLSVCLAFAFFVASAAAQMAPGGSQGSQSSSPSMQQPSQQQPGGMNQPENSPSSAQTDQGTANQNHNNSMGEKKIKGCVQSEGGQYMLETKKGKTVSLTGQDVSAHVGHEVEVKGTWEKGMSATSSGSTGASGRTLNVTEVKMISDTCSGKGTSHSGSMDHSSTGTANSGNTTGNSGNSSSQPPQ
ncbi:MAG: DUF5818 domain-containing protein [Terriglobales bacterium]